MTITTDRAAQVVTNPRELMDPELFGELSRRVMKELHVTQGYAERVIEQTIVFLKACASTDARLSPSVQVDPGWHAFLLYTRDYAAFCQQVAGEFIHHRAVWDHDISSGAALARTIKAIQETGLTVDMELWAAPESCGPCCDKA